MERAGKHALTMGARQWQDRQTFAQESLFFDKAKGDAAVEFFPRFLRLVDGEWAGKPFHLEDWQAHHVVRQIFGWRRRKNGLRRYRFVRGWVPRKNGKTEEAPGSRIC
jgi:phage terminase large subunit-like protein